MRKRKPFRPRCPHCAADRVHAHGRTKAGTPRYRCLSCNRTFIRRTGTSWHRRRLRLEFLRFQKLVHRGNSVRKDARLLDVSPSTVWRWRHEHMARLAQQESPPALPSGAAAVTTYSLLARRTFWGNLPNTAWAHRHGLDYLDARREQELRGQECTAVTFIAGPPQGGRATFAVFTHAAQAPLHLVLDGAGQRSDAYRITGTWALPIEDDARRPLPLHAVLREPEHRRLDGARQAVMALETVFRRWSARFRGLALRHLKRYVAWFNDLLARGTLDHLHLGKPFSWVRT